MGRDDRSAAGAWRWKAFLFLGVALIALQGALWVMAERSHSSALATATAKATAAPSKSMVLDSNPSGADVTVLSASGPIVALGRTPLLLDYSSYEERTRVSLGLPGYRGAWTVPTGGRGGGVVSVDLAPTVPVLSALIFLFPCSLPALACLLMAAWMTRRAALVDMDLDDAVEEVTYVGEEGAVGPYRLLNLLGKGAMAEVYLARRLDAEGKAQGLAIKIIQPQIASDPQFRARLEREVAIAKSLEHDNIVKVIDAGEDGGQLYMVMEYVRGTSLRERIQGSGGKGLSPRQSVSLMIPVIAAVAHAHARGVVHRDLKPENVLLTRDGTPKVSDFGMARAEESETITGTGMMLGTPAYMAPEQVSSPRTTPRADIYSLGCILYELLAGRLPFTGGFEEIVFRRLREEAPPLRSVQPDVPEALETIVMRMLRKDPDERAASCDAVHEALVRLLPKLR